MVFKNGQQPQQGDGVIIYLKHGVDSHEVSANIQELEAVSIQICEEHFFAVNNRPQTYIPDDGIRTLT